MNEFDVCAAWMTSEEKIGHCVIENARGKEIIGFASERFKLLYQKTGNLKRTNFIYPIMKKKECDRHLIQCFK